MITYIEYHRHFFHKDLSKSCGHGNRVAGVVTGIRGWPMHVSVLRIIDVGRESGRNVSVSVT